MGSPGTVLDELVNVAETELATICRQRNVDLLTAFGSAVRPDAIPHDLDLGVRFAGPPDILGFLRDLEQVADTSVIDLMDLGTASLVARERALVPAILLFEAFPGLFVHAQMAAMMERMDTEWLRRLDLELMSA